MLATRDLPADFVAFNRTHGAPFGRASKLIDFTKSMSWSLYLRLAGPFAIQPNSTLRVFEYPWAFTQLPVHQGARVVEIGGGLSGFQFALARAGAHVVNVDPGMEAKGVGWPCDEATIRRLNQIYGTDVELRNTVMKDAALPPDRFDCVYSISVIEHLPDDDIVDAVTGAYRCLKPGGRFILTVDLFLNLAPFTSRKTNIYGRNIDLKWLAGIAPFQIEWGEKAQMNGFAEFATDPILSELERYYIGAYPALSQCFVLRKPA